MTRIIIFFFILVGIGIGIKTDAAIFNWSRGEPKVLGNSDTTYFSWRAGEPAVFYQYQAAAPPAGGAIPVPPQAIWW